MNKGIEKNIESVVKLTNGDRLAIVNENNSQKIYILNKDNDILVNLSEDEARNKLSFAYRYNNEQGEAVFYLKGEALNTEATESNYLLSFIRKLRYFLSIKTYNY